MTLEMSAETAASADGTALLEALALELAGLYDGERSAAGFEGEQELIVARRDGVAVGCGVLRPLAEGIAELDRMFVPEVLRRQGIGRALLDELERRAREQGYRAIWLETGRYQIAATLLYMTSGYEPTACYGDYLDDPLSVCFKKQL